MECIPFDALLIKLLLPMLIGLRVILQQCLFSFSYLLLFFSLQWWNTRMTSLKTRVGFNLAFKITVALSCAFQLVQITFQMVRYFLLSTVPITFCSPTERILRHVGLIEWTKWDPAPIIISIIPDFVLTCFLLIVIKRIKRKKGDYEMTHKMYENIEGVKKTYRRITFAAHILQTILLVLAAALSPSVLGLLYFVVALVAAVVWAWKDKSIYRKALLIILLSVVATHILAVFSIQMQWVQETVPEAVLKILGLTVVITIDCSIPYKMILTSASWEAYLIAPVLMTLYSTTACILHHARLSEKLEYAAIVRKLKKNSARSSRTESIYHSESYRSIRSEGKPQSNIWKAIQSFDYRGFLEETITITACSCMLIWSVLLISWPALVLLVWAAALCLIPRMKARTLESSPLLVFYAYLLMSVNYLFHVYPIENKEHFKFLTEYGVLASGAFSTSILAECLFTAVFLVLFRQYIKERKRKDSKKLLDIIKRSSDTFGSHVQFVDFVMQKARYFFSVCWITVVLFMMVVIICVGDTVTLFRVLFALLFVFFVLVFQFTYDGWRNIQSNYWLTLGVITLLALMLQYTYHFQKVRELWNMLGLREESQKKIGLDISNYLGIILCSVLLIAVMAQIQFNDDFLEATNIKKRVTESYDEDLIKKLINYTETHDFGKISGYVLKRVICIMKFASTCLKYCEQHISKLIIVLIAWLTTRHISALHWVIFTLLLISLLMRHHWRDLFLKCITILVGIHLLQWMLFVLLELHETKFLCTQLVTTDFSAPPVYLNYTHGLLRWVGLVQQHPDPEITKEVILNHMLVLIFSTAAVAMSRFMMFRGFLKGEIVRYSYIIFRETTRKEADSDVINCCKFLVNYTFYKFGVEICFIGMAIIVGLRWDFFSIFLLLCLITLYALPRPVLSCVWNLLVYCCILSLILEYALFLAPPPMFCLPYPWYNNRIWRILRDWLLTPDPFYPKDSHFVFYEVLLILIMCRQKVVFSIEKKFGEGYVGGGNEIPGEKTDHPNFDNPVPDFITFIRSWLDIWKQCFFNTIYWTSLVVLFLTSYFQVNFFSVGYMTASFILFWKGEDFYLYSLPTIYRHWNMIIAYNLLVMLVKIIVQLLINMFVRFYGRYMCLILDALSLKPYQRSDKSAHLTQAIVVDETCVTSNQYVIVWDIICFSVLIIARRAFMTYYFVHVINDAKAVAMIASRGAQMFDQIRLQRIKMQEEKERAMIDYLAQKMADLRLKQQKLQQHPLFVSPSTHYEAIRAGDYFMFVESEIQEEDEERMLQKERQERERQQRRIMRAVATQSGLHPIYSLGTRGRKPLPISMVIAETKAQTLFSAVRVIQHRRGQVKLAKDFDPDIVLDVEEDVEEELEMQLEKIKEKSVNLRLTRMQHFETFVVWLYYLVDASLLSLAITMYGYTGTYRFVVEELNKEKKLLLDRKALAGYRADKNSPWTPITRKTGRYPPIHNSSEARESTDKSNLQDAERAQGKFLHRSYQFSCFSLITSLYYIILAYSELVCYFLIVLLQVLEPSLISLFMAFSMFLWATLSTPRPSKVFWVVLMTYIEIILILKTILLFHSLSSSIYTMWDKMDLFDILGLNTSLTTTILFLCLFMSILFHRFRQRKFGLWDNADHMGSTLLGASVVLEGATSSTESSFWDDKTHNSEGHLTPLNSEMTGFKRETRTTTTAYFPSVLVLEFIKYRNISRHFFHKLLTSPTRIRVDTYSWLFFLYAICFFMILFGIKHFSAMQRSWYWYFDRNRFPLSLFFLLFGHFCIMVAERIIYVRKNIKAKLVLYIGDVICTHIYLFLYLPFYAYRKVNDSALLQIFYVIRSLYFLISAYQIRGGYAIYEHGYLFRYKYGMFYWIWYYLYMYIPFFFELRTVVDWTASDTSMTLKEYLKMEDVYYTAYSVKCGRSYEKSYPKSRGRNKTVYITIFMGGGILLLFIGLLWFPLLLFRLRHQLGQAQVPQALHLSVYIESYPVIYDARSFIVHQFTDSEWEVLSQTYKTNRRAQEQVEYFTAQDLSAAKLPTLSKVWDIPRESRIRIATLLRGDNDITIKIAWEVSYFPDSDIKGYRIRTLSAGDSVREQLATMIESPVNATPGYVEVSQMLPKFLDTSQSQSAIEEYSTVNGDFLDESAFRNIRLTLHDANTRRQINNEPLRFQFWEMQEVCSGHDWDVYLRKLPQNDCTLSIVIYVFSEKKFGFWLDLLSSMGSKAIYYGILWIVWQVCRNAFRGSTARLGLTEMPYPDRILDLCHDIYAVRMSKNYILEEDLFAKLIFLLRSPEVLIMFTRKPIVKKTET